VGKQPDRLASGRYCVDPRVTFHSQPYWDDAMNRLSAFCSSLAYAADINRCFDMAQIINQDIAMVDSAAMDQGANHYRSY
jgi:hypothetical protein